MPTNPGLSSGDLADQHLCGNSLMAYERPDIEPARNPIKLLSVFAGMKVFSMKKEENRLYFPLPTQYIALLLNR